jgi:hypothetical protein
MGDPSSPDPAMIVIGVIHSDESTLDSAIEKLNLILGPLRRAGESFPFRWTDYYEEEMGAELTRCFLASQRLVERQCLVELKQLCNRIERELAKEDGSRRINLDPGLMTLENFVLATAKNRGHRIYLRDGIFAEVTLMYVQGRFEALPWTFPDYRSEEIQGVLLGVREEYYHLLRDSAPEVMTLENIGRHKPPGR